MKDIITYSDFLPPLEENGDIMKAKSLNNVGRTLTISNQKDSFITPTNSSTYLIKTSSSSISSTLSTVSSANSHMNCGEQLSSAEVRLEIDYPQQAENDFFARPTLTDRETKVIHFN